MYRCSVINASTEWRLLIKAPFNFFHIDIVLTFNTWTLFATLVTRWPQSSVTSLVMLSNSQCSSFQTDVSSVSDDGQFRNVTFLTNHKIILYGFSTSVSFAFVMTWFVCCTVDFVGNIYIMHVFELNLKLYFFTQI